ncbi:MAG: hypothetical protein JWR61_1402 [Ferruginibacter sp.]|uniref:hypothetical protein n=1 Tax=Ferruginibacter sp. TaxID=1940288 RepID=UPI00265A14A7|nr:hypothetical protein [Ferruginibacter sp.]MDB5276447.1 hypothetical protein [Ferruginibacter sp.]
MVTFIYDCTIIHFEEGCRALLQDRRVEASNRRTKGDTGKWYDNNARDPYTNF